MHSGDRSEIDKCKIGAASGIGDTLTDAISLRADICHRAEYKKRMPVPLPYAKSTEVFVREGSGT